MALHLGHATADACSRVGDKAKHATVHRGNNGHAFETQFGFGNSDLGLDQNTWMRGVSPSLNYGGSPTTPFSFLGCELYAKGTDSDDAKVAALKKLKDKSIHSVAAAVAAGYTLTEAGKAGAGGWRGER